MSELLSAGSELSRRIIERFDRQSNLLLAGTILLLAGVAAAMLLWGTSEYGIGIERDTVDYIQADRYLVQGVGLGRVAFDGTFKPLNHFPPLYPLLLAGFQATGFGDLAGARFLGALFYSTTVVLAGVATFRLTHSFWFAALGALALLLSPIIINVSLWAMTETLYISLTLLALLLLDTYLLKGSYTWLLGAATCTALVYLTRYIGIANILAGLGGILLLSSAPVRRRIVPAAAFGVIALTPTGLWILSNYLVSGSGTNRTFLFHPILPETIQEFWDTLGRIGRPLQDTFQIGRRKVVAVLAAFGAFFTYGFLSRGAAETQTRPPSRLGALLAFFCLAYAAVLTTSLFFFDALTPLDDRILAPLYVPALLLLLAALHRLLWVAYRLHPALSALPLVLYVLVVVSFVQYNTGEAAYLFTWSKEQGLGFANRRVVNSQLVRQLQEIPADYLLVSNNIDQVYLFTGRPAFPIPGRIDLVRQTPVEDYNETLARIGKEIRQRKVAIILFGKDEGDRERISRLYPELSLMCNCGNGYVFSN